MEKQVRNHSLLHRLQEKNVISTNLREWFFLTFEIGRLLFKFKQDKESSWNMIRGIFWFNLWLHLKLSSKGCINFPNQQIWDLYKSSRIPSLHSPKVTAWCAISSAGIIGPCYFEENEAAVTVNSNH